MDFFEVGGSSSSGRLVVEVSQLADVDVNQDYSAPSDPAVGLTVAAGPHGVQLGLFPRRLAFRAGLLEGFIFGHLSRDPHFDNVTRRRRYS